MWLAHDVSTMGPMQRDATDFEPNPRTPGTLSLAQLRGQHARLEGDLAMAFNATPWNQGRVQRIVDEMASIELLIAERAGGV